MAKEILVKYEKTLEDGTKEDGRVTMMVPESFDETKQMWGEDVGMSKMIAKVKIDAQNICRNAENPEQAQELINIWVPGVTRERESGTSKKAIIELIKGANLTKEELAELVAKIKGA
jgi:hypothetical protein